MTQYDAILLLSFGGPEDRTTSSTSGQCHAGPWHPAGTTGSRR